MQDQGGELKPIALEYLFDGMVLEENIYNFDGKVLLLAKGNVLHDNQIRQLRDFNASQWNISVHETTYRKLIEHGMTSVNMLAQEYLEERVGYTAIKEKAGEMLDEVQRAGRIEKEAADGVAEDIREKLHTISPSMIFQCIDSPNPIDEYLRRHSINVAFLNGMMAKWVGLPEADVNALVLTGLVHDIGKTKIPDEILNVPRKLTISEFEVVKMHTVFSYELLSMDEKFAEQIRLAALYHHEKMNGSGYPKRLVADQIPQYAKITAVSDIYDAMVSQRSYKAANNPFAIISRLASQQFSELDMQLVRLFTQHMPVELMGKPCLMSDGSIGIIRCLMPGAPEYPLVEINGNVTKTDEKLYCKRMILEE